MSSAVCHERTASQNIEGIKGLQLVQALVVGGGWLTVCRLASRAYEHWRGLLRANNQLSGDSGELAPAERTEAHYGPAFFAAESRS